MLGAMRDHDDDNHVRLVVELCVGVGVEPLLHALLVPHVDNMQQQPAMLRQRQHVLPALLATAHQHRVHFVSDVQRHLQLELEPADLCDALWCILVDVHVPNVSK